MNRDVYIKLDIDRSSDFRPVFRFEEYVAASGSLIGKPIMQRRFGKDPIEIGVVIGVEVNGNDLFAVVRLKTNP